MICLNNTNQTHLLHNISSLPYIRDQSDAKQNACTFQGTASVTIITPAFHRSCYIRSVC